MAWSSPAQNLLILDEDKVDKLQKTIEIFPESLRYTTCTGSSLLHCCTLTDKPKSMVLLLSKGCDVNCINDFNETPLHWVAKSGTLKNFRVLILYGADINAIDTDGNTPLHWACESGNIEIIEALLNNPKIDLEVENLDGFTPVEVSFLNGDNEATNLFLQKGVKLRQNILPYVDYNYKMCYV